MQIRQSQLIRVLASASAYFVSFKFEAFNCCYYRQTQSPTLEARDLNYLGKTDFHLTTTTFRYFASNLLVSSVEVEKWSRNVKNDNRAIR